MRLAGALRRAALSALLVWPLGAAIAQPVPVTAEPAVAPLDPAALTAVCPKGHPNEITLNGKTESVVCQAKGCGLQCRRD